MFIHEQIGNTYRDFQYAVAMEDQYLTMHVWSPVSNRHTNWTYKPKRERVDWYA